jgi:hypothetical protein
MDETLFLCFFAVNSMEFAENRKMGNILLIIFAKL